MRNTTVHEIDGFNIEVKKLDGNYGATIKDGNRYYGLWYRNGNYAGPNVGETGGDGVTVYDLPDSVMQDAMIKAIKERIAADESAT